MNLPTARLNVLQMADVTGRGGAEKALVDLALGLDRQRYNVMVCATRYTGNYQPLLDAAGVPTISLERHTRRDFYKLAGLVRLLRARHIHILHSHLFGSNTWGRLLGRLAGVPILIAHEHGSSWPRHEVWIDRLLYRLSDRILVPSAASKAAMQAIQHIPPRALQVVYNGVDVAQFVPPTAGERAATRAGLGLPADAPVIGLVGRLSADKGGQDILLRAVAALRPDHPHLRLLIVGDGPLRPDLEALAGELGLGDGVIFAGRRPDVSRLLGALDVFVLPSRLEALPIAVLEAMAVGVPVVATAVGGTPEVVTDGATGLLVPPGDPAALGAALARLLDTPSLAARLGAAGHTHVHAHFTLAHLTARVASLYEQLATQKL